MDWNAWASYAPVIVGTIILGVITNRADKGIDIAGRMFIKNSTRRRDRRKLRQDKEIAHVLASNFPSGFFIIKATRDIFMLVFGATFLGVAIVLATLNSDFHPGEYNKLYGIAVSAISELLGIYAVLTAYFAFGKCAPSTIGSSTQEVQTYLMLRRRLLNKTIRLQFRHKHRVHNLQPLTSHDPCRVNHAIFRPTPE